MHNSNPSEDLPNSPPNGQLHAFFGPEIWQLQDQGGVSRYFGELIRNMSKLGTNTTAFLPNSKNQYAKLIPLENRYYVEDQSEENLIAISKELRHQSDIRGIYHATYFSANDLKKIENANLSTVVTVHDLISEKFPEKKLLKRPRFSLTKKTIRNVKHIICVSRNTKNDLLDYYDVPEEKVTVIYLGSNLQTSKSNRKKPSQKVPYLLFVGKRRGYKNFDTLLRAFSEIHTLKMNFQIVAFGGGAFERSEVETMKSLGIERNIVHISGDDAVLSAFYEGAFALVYPSLYEGFGLPPVEAMNLGCPVIASNKGSIPEICKDAVLYFNPYDKDDLASILEESLGNPEIMNQKIISGRKVSREYTWEKTAFETNQVYRQL